MMNKKGFTLIELIGVVIILALIFLLVFPNILTMERNRSDDEYETMKKSLCLAGETYINLNKDKFASLTSIELYINALMELEYIDSKIIDPKEDKSIKNSKLLYVYENDELKCTYQFIE